MGEEALSRSEVESLLYSGEAGGYDAAPGRRRGAAAAPRQAPLGAAGLPPREPLAVLRTLHEEFCRRLSAALSELLRTDVDAKMPRVVMLRCGEFLYGLPNPTCLNIVEAEAVEGMFLLDLEPRVLYPMIDRMLGGAADATAWDHRPLTDIELRLVSRITDRCLAELASAWRDLLPLELRVQRVASNPQLVRNVDPTDEIVLFGAELHVGEARGGISLAAPRHVTHCLLNQLGVHAARASGVPDAAGRPTLPPAGSFVELVVHLAKTRIDRAELAELQVGDMITTDHPVEAPLEVSLDGEPRFRAAPGALRQRKAVQIVADVAPPEAE